VTFVAPCSTEAKGKTATLQLRQDEDSPGRRARIGGGGDRPSHHHLDSRMITGQSIVVDAGMT
jgi:hypothetical protein